MRTSASAAALAAAGTVLSPLSAAAAPALPALAAASPAMPYVSPSVPLVFPGLDGDRVASSHPSSSAPFLPAWMEQRIAAADGQADDLFGFRVLITGDTAFVSAPAPIYRPGKVYVYTNVGGVWTETQQITPTPESDPPPGWSDFFGWSLSRSGDTLMIGAPFAFDTMLGPIGAAYVFDLSGGTWTQTAELTALDAATTDYFGWAVAISGDTALIGANSHNRGANGTEGAAYVFVNSGGTWSQTQELESSDSTPGDGRQFGSAVEFDGTTMLISSPGPDYSSNGIYPQGAAYVFTNSGGTWSEVQALTASDGVLGDQFGFSIALDGTRAVVGAPAADIDSAIHQGAAYVFDSVGGTWSETQKLTASDGIAYDQLGQSVALHGDTALAGMWSRDDDPNDPPPPGRQGIVHVFTQAGGAWSESGELTSSVGSEGDSFGWDVDLDGTTILIGSQESIGANPYQGAAYTYLPDPAPVADVTPGSLDTTLESGASTSATLTIANTGGGSLSFSIAEADADCASPSDVPWLSEDPASGDVAAGTSSDVTVGVDATALAPGDYSAMVCVATNDPANAMVAVPVGLTVTQSDRIFADGFEGGR